MKKVKLLLVLLIFSFMSVSCVGSKSNFTEVSRVTFTSNGETKTIYSTWYIKRGDFKSSTKSEYDVAEFKTSVMAPPNVTTDTIEIYCSDIFSGNIYSIIEKPYKPHGISSQDIGKYFYIYAHDLGHYSMSYFKAEIKEVGAMYLQVKVINDTTIVIKRGSIETTYTVTSYSIVK